MHVHAIMQSWYKSDYLAKKSRPVSPNLPRHLMDSISDLGLELFFTFMIPNTRVCAGNSLEGEVSKSIVWVDAIQSGWALQSRVPSAILLAPSLLLGTPSPRVCNVNPQRDEYLLGRKSATL